MNAEDRIEAAKAALEERMRNRKALLTERQRRRNELAEKLQDETLSGDVKETLKEEFKKEEASVLRKHRKKMSAKDFDSLAIVGRGAFGEVHLVRERDTGRLFALKIMSKAAMIMKNQASNVRAERDAMARAVDEWVVRLHYSFQDDSYLYLVMDFMPGGDLMSLLIKEDVLPEEAVRFYAAEAVLAIESVHKLGYVHRDLKPDNLLLDPRGHLRLTDLGLCKKLDEEVPGEELIHEAQKAAPGMTKEAPSMHPTARQKRDRRLVRHGTMLCAAQTTNFHAALFRSFVSDCFVGFLCSFLLFLQAYSTVGTPDYIAPEVLLRKGYGKAVSN